MSWKTFATNYHRMLSYKFAGELRESAKSGEMALATCQFKALLTLFPKFFSHFPHGTCTLSDSEYVIFLGLPEPPKFAFHSHGM